MPRWSVRRRPHPRLLSVGALIAVILGVGGAWLLPALMVEPNTWLGVLAGSAIAIATFAILASGASASLDDQGILRYGFGRRIDIEVPIAATSNWRVLRGGLLSGIGCTVDSTRVILHSRKVASPNRMADWRRDLGVDLVFEHLTAADAAALDAASRTQT